MLEQNYTCWPNDINEAIQSLPRANEDLSSSASMKQNPEDFQVDEVLGFEPDGEGDHAWLQIIKSNQNTMDVANLLAKNASVSSRDIGFSGLKDKYATTSQWFSVPKTDFGLDDITQWDLFRDASLSLKSANWSNRKLKRGSHKSNGFTITLRDVTGEKERMEAGLKIVREYGVPNYFGIQRFGRGGSNLQQAKRLFEGAWRPSRRQHAARSMALSAARSWIFNLALAARVDHGSWNQLLVGDALQFDGSGSFFLFDDDDDSVLERIATRVLHPTGPLWGKGDLPLSDEALQIEIAATRSLDPICSGLCEAGLKQQRRALRLNVDDLDWEWLDSETLRMRFVLTSGAFATSVLRELSDIKY